MKIVLLFGVLFWSGFLYFFPKASKQSIARKVFGLQWCNQSLWEE